MKLETIFELIKYLDCFGTTFTFYTEKSRKFYTTLGGILTVLSIIFGLLIFIYINLEEFLHNNPNSTISTKKDEYKKIKFGEEKIWIPWRIRNFGGKTINHKDLLYPIIFYYKGIRNDTLKSLEVTYDFVNYKLCNETSMVNNSDLYMIDIDIGQFYCIDMENLDMGGSWDSDFLDLVTFDLYVCKNGINYDEKNPNCSTYEKIIEAAGSNDCFEFEIYYPVVYYQPINKTNPIFVRYYNYFYHFSRYSNKIDRIYLQQHIFEDDIGWIFKNVKSSSHWGTVSFNGDSYATGDEKDLMNEGSTSRLYSFNIYLKSDITFYHRSYKKFFLILTEGLPIINIIIIFFKFVAKIFKISSGNKKLTELLFENSKIKKMKISSNQLNSFKKKSKKLDINKKDNVKNAEINLQINLNTSNKINDISSLKLIQHNFEKKKIIPNIDSNYFSIGKNNIKKKRLSTKYNIINNIYDSNYKSFTNNNNIDNNFVNNNILHNNIEDFFSIQSNNISSNFNSINKNTKKKINENDNKSNDNSSIQIKTKTKTVKKTLFPYRYYLCSIFIKNIKIYRNYIFFTKKFLVVYNFICQLFDISSYLILKKEFEIMKNTLLIDKYRDILENKKKINVNDLNFNLNMKECLDSKNFSILGKIK